MKSIRKLPPDTIPFMVILAGCFMLFIAFIKVTVYTANILAWGFDGIPHLEKTSFALFVYEMVYPTYAYPGFLLGLLLIGLTACVFFARGTLNALQVKKTLWIIWGIGVASFLLCNVTLILLPDPTYFPKYLHMMITNPDPGGAMYDQVIDPFRLWHYALPTTIAMILFFVSVFTFSVRIQTIIITLPLLLAPMVLEYYRCYIYLAAGEHIYYSFFLNLLTPVIILAPVTIFIYVTRRLGTRNTDT